jgi:peptidoglycan/xylan/chitin deacetylase (PgdA/CDA1 family)
MTKLLTCFLLLQAAISVAVAQQTAEAVNVAVARWPQDRRAAISLTFDDAMNSHLDVVEPILKKRGLTATFFVSTGRDVWRNRKEEWRRLGNEGNELANHTVKHPCLLEVIEPHSQSYTPEMMEAEIRDAALEIQRLLNTHRGLTFAYPCGDTSFGPPPEQARNAALYLRFVSDYAFGARGWRNDGSGGLQDPDELGVLNVNNLGVTAGKDFIGLLSMAEPALRGGNWGVYGFHGVGGEWLSITSASLDELASYLEHHSEIWTAPFGDVLRYIQERKAAIINIKRPADDSIQLMLQWPMDAQIYDLPLTLKVEVPAMWTSATAKADGKPLNSKVIEQKESTMILVDVPAQTKTVSIVSSGR